MFRASHARGAETKDKLGSSEETTERTLIRASRRPSKYSEIANIWLFTIENLIRGLVNYLAEIKTVRIMTNSGDGFSPEIE